MFDRIQLRNSLSNKMKYRKKIALFTLFVMNLVDQPAPEVKIEQGILSGKISGDGSFFEYMGIPYATVDSSTRFKAPLPPPKWEGTYRAVDEMYSCPQPWLIGVIGSEDCLKINVFVPAMATRPLPVMVYIHGGAFIFGSGGKLLYGPDFLVQHDVIVVTFNYRLGALGFICLGIEDAPGNAGLKDQIAALRWVKKNIAAFGGDPDNITLFGESAGATSSSVLLASEATDGLFNRVIMQSGSSSNWSVNRNPIWIASLFAKELGYNTEDPHEIYKILSHISYKELIKLKPFKPLGLFFDTRLLSLPCIERPIPGVEAVLTDLPYNLFRNKPKNIPVIHGSMSKEGFLLTANENDDTLKERNERYLFASDLEFVSESEANDTTDKIKHFYFGDEAIQRSNIMSLQKMYTELYFEIPAAMESDILTDSGNAPVYNYYFNYSGGRNVVKFRTGYANETGACHADDLFYIFKSSLWPFLIDDKDSQIIQWITRMWTNFAKYGDPTPDFDGDFPVKWLPSTRTDLKYLYIDEVFKMGPMPHLDSFYLWKDIYAKYRRMNLSYYL